MDKWERTYKIEEEAIKEERKFYPGAGNEVGIKVLDVLSLIFLLSGFVALILIFFTDVTLVQATCLFVISYTIAPSDGDIFRQGIKGIMEDVGYIRLNITVIRKYLTQMREK